jgi:hypothetical protein
MSGSGGEMNKERRIYSSSGIEAKGLRKKKKERVVGGGSFGRLPELLP